MQIKFENVKGYATYANAQKRGEEVAANAEKAVGPRAAHMVRWVVVALPNGRYAPSFIIGHEMPFGPGLFIGQVNVCSMN